MGHFVSLCFGLGGEKFGLWEFKLFKSECSVFLIFLIALLVDAGCSAVMDMILQARLVSAFNYAFSGDRHSAGSGFIELLDDL